MARNDIENMKIRTDLKKTREYLGVTLDGIIGRIQPSYIHDSESNPLDIELYIDEDGFGTLSKIDFGGKYLEYFESEPETYLDKMPSVIDALRELADKIELIHRDQLDLDRQTNKS